MQSRFPKSLPSKRLAHALVGGVLPWSDPSFRTSVAKAGLFYRLTSLKRMFDHDLRL